ncbi:LysR family transcriptional regulator [Gottfriedia acidiceleris]|uniref:LysR family transcriptional regulator n=1 Tax=Gottfriedia acidiceleris TaxID=371036 RepID=UPI003D25F3D9
MNFNQLEYIVEVANEKSITKAAEKSHISPSAISQSIAQLEKELNISIFYRNSKGVILTPQGKILVEKAHDILNNLKDLHTRLKQYEKSKSNHLKISFAPTFSNIVHAAILNILDEVHDFTFELEEENAQELLKRFNMSDLDLAFLPALKNELNEYHVLYDHLHTGYLCIAVGKESNLYQKDFVTFDDLINQKFIFHKLISKNILKMFDLNNNKEFLSSNKGNSIYDMIVENRAITVLHNISFINHPTVLNGELKIIPFKTPDFIYQDFWVLHRPLKLKSGIADSLISCVKSIMSISNSNL